MTTDKPIQRVRPEVKTAVLKAVHDHFKAHRIPCTFRELAAMTGYSHTTTHQAVRELQAQNKLMYEPSKSRSVRPKR